ncbi:hypothetical protein P692DRAFT_20838893 [Suillus brevipes Sb2]|nr:hypothetical protein P692DRAFT_20838893 [Suillus brevipes Sb2]
MSSPSLLLWYHQSLPPPLMLAPRVVPYYDFMPSESEAYFCFHISDVGPWHC